MLSLSKHGSRGRGNHARGATTSFSAVLVALALLLAAPAAMANTVIVALGDSLTAGYGLPPEEAFPAQLEARLKRQGAEARVVNAGVSGDTSAGGLARLDWALADAPDLVIVELGANDALRGISPALTRANLDAILARLVARGVKVLLTGMRAPPNLGRDYGGEFDVIYPELAAKHGVALYPFFLGGVAAEPALNQHDGIHPNAEGVAIIVERLAPHVLALIDGD
jgi:acyl-CoA thioesterase-1